SVDAQLRAATSGNAHYFTARSEARRRKSHRRPSRYWVSTLRVRKNRRALELQPVRHRDRPYELHLADDQQRGLARRGGAPSLLGADAALQIHPHHRCGVVANQRSLAMQRRGRTRYGRFHVLLIRLLSARSYLRHL